MKAAVIGAGNMGGAIARGIARGNLIRTEDLTVSNPSSGKLEALQADFPALHVTTDNRAAAAGADRVILAVKPWKVEEVLSGLGLVAGQVLVSVAAGVSFADLEQAANIGTITAEEKAGEITTLLSGVQHSQSLGLLLVSTLLPCILMYISYRLYRSHYKLDEAEYDRICAEIAERNPE